MRIWSFSLILPVFLSVYTAKAQSNSVATGGDFSGAGGSIGFTVGQIDYKNQETSSGKFTQGVQQPIEIFNLGTDGPSDIQLYMAVYPNPSASTVYLDIGGLASLDLEYTLMDIHFRKIYSERITLAQTPISVERLANATYLLRVAKDKKPLKTFKIIVNN